MDRSGHRSSHPPPHRRAELDGLLFQPERLHAGRKADGVLGAGRHSCAGAGVETLFCGDGGDGGQVAHAKDGKCIYLFRPTLNRIDSDSPEGNQKLIQPGVLHSERLVNMAKHNYKLEPNVRFSPDRKMVLFTSNMFGPSYVFGVDIEKAAAGDRSEGK